MVKPNLNLRRLGGLLFLLLGGLSGFAQIIPANRLVPWEGNVGVSGGIPNSSRMTVFANFTSTATRADVQSALAACPSNQVVHLAAGTYNWSGDLDFQGIGDGKVLKGDVDANGVPTTRILSSGSVAVIRAYAQESSLSTDADLTADGKKGDTTISVATPTWVTVGGVIGIDQLDDPNLSFNPGQESGTSYRQITGNGARGMAQLVRVTAKTATTITFDTPLAWTFSTALSAQIFKPFTEPSNMRKKCGIENLIWEHTGAGSSDNHMFKFETAQDCWLKNVYGTNLVGGIYVFGIGSYRCEIRHCRFDNSKSLGGGQGYGIGLYHFCTQWLIEDNIFRKLHVGMQNNYGSCYNVFAYNFETDGQSDSGQNPGMSGHGTTGYMTLFEGNWCMDKFLGDFTHGAGCFYTVFRNRIVGKNPAQTQDQTVISNERYNRKLNVVGNLLGSSGWHNKYMIAPAGGGYNNSTATCSDQSIYKMGFFANIGCNGSAIDSFTTMDPVLAVNYDVVTTTNNGIVLGGFTTSDLVNSYYIGSKPAYFGQCPWPPYSPAATSAAAMSPTNIPAGYRYVYGIDPPVGGPDLTPPTAPVSLVASPSGTNQIVLSWGASSDDVGVTGYQIERQAPGSSSFVQVGTSVTTSYTNTGLIAGTNYAYRIRATDAAGNLSAYSAVATTTTLRPDSQPPTTPPNLAAVAASSSQINVTWTASTDNIGVANYQVERSQGAGSTSYAQVATPSGTSFSDSGLSASTVYNYRVRAADTNGNLSGYSTVASATTQNPPPDSTPPTVPGGLVGTAISSNRIDLSWTVSTDNVGVTGYQVERSQGTGATNFVQVGAPAGAAFSNTGLIGGTVYNYRVRATDANGNLSGYSAIASISTPRPEAGLVAAYAFDEGNGGTVSDSSGNGNNGVITGAAWVNGKFGKALSFNGTSSMITINDAPSLDPTTGITLEAWVYPTALSTSWSDIIYKSPDTYFLMGTTPQAQAPDLGGTFASANVYGTKLTLNAWSHVAGTYDGATMKFYLNGALVSSRAQTGSIAPSSGALFIGGDTANGQYWTGLIDEVRIYNRALSPSELQADFNDPIMGTRPAAPQGVTVTP